jgi:hypothetical protein
MKTKIEDKTIVIFQLLLAIAVVVTISTIGPPALRDLNESLQQQVQQVCIINLLQAEMLNTTPSIKEAAINNIINSPGCQSFFSNNTTNNG